MSEKPKFTQEPSDKVNLIDYMIAKICDSISTIETKDERMKKDLHTIRRVIKAAPEMWKNMVDSMTTIDLATSNASTICANSCCWGRNCSSCPVSEIIRLLGGMKERTGKLKNEVDGEA